MGGHLRDRSAWMIWGLVASAYARAVLSQQSAPDAGACFEASVAHADCGCAPKHSCTQFRSSALQTIGDTCDHLAAFEGSTDNQCRQYAGRCKNPVNEPGMSSFCCCVKVAGTNCEVSDWSSWGQCTTLCGGGERIRTRYVTRAPTGAGNVCPSLRDSRPCNPDSCQPNEVYVWGKGQYGRLGVGDDVDQRVPRVISSLQGETVQQVVGGYSHSLALTSKGAVFVWGRNWNGQLGTGLLAGRIPIEYATPQHVCCLENASVVDIAAGSYHSLALTADERVIMWGWNNEGERGNGEHGPQVECRAFAPTARLFRFELCGSFDWVQSILTPEYIEVLDTERIFAIAAGAGHTVALSRKSQLFAWGQHQHGQLGLGEAAPKQMPMPVSARSIDATTKPLQPSTAARAFPLPLISLINFIRRIIPSDPEPSGAERTGRALLLSVHSVALRALHGTARNGMADRRRHRCAFRSSTGSISRTCRRGCTITSRSTTPACCGRGATTRTPRHHPSHAALTRCNAM